MQKLLQKMRCLILASCFVLALTGCAGQTNADPSANASVPTGAATTIAPPPESLTPDAPAYKDGTYEVETTKDYEGYYAKGSMIVKDGKITDFKYDLYDSRNGDALFDEAYEDYMPSQNYKQQCRDDLKGMRTYGPKLVETQSVDEVDVVSKATWTWKWFKKVAKELIELAQPQ